MLELEDPIEAEEAEAKESDQGGDRNRMSRLTALQHLQAKIVFKFLQILTAIAASASCR